MILGNIIAASKCKFKVVNENIVLRLSEVLFLTWNTFTSTFSTFYSILAWKASSNYVHSLWNISVFLEIRAAEFKQPEMNRTANFRIFVFVFN